MSKVKILSGWSNPGGATWAHIYLTNLLNDNGFDCTFYGPHDWHKDKCKSGTLKEVRLNKGETVISHFLQIQPREKVKKHILSCHETNLMLLKDMDLSRYDVVQYVSQGQKDWHGVDYPSVIIPPIVSKIKWIDPKNNTAGVIGSIDPHKQTHIAIQNALDAGYSKVLLFGHAEPTYYHEKIVPMVEASDQVVVMGHTNDREALYGEISAVFHASKRETYGLVEAECKLAGIPFFGTSNKYEILSDEEILKRWKELLI